jgi:predicted amidohydrolase
LRLALIQMRCREGQREDNIRTAERYLVRAAKSGADLVALPECFVEFARIYAEPVPDGPVCRRFSALARSLGIHLVMGSIGEKSGEKIYNTACLFDPRGKLVGKYRKRFLWCSERARITPGRSKRPAVFRTALGQIGLAICWDLAFPEHFRELALAGAELTVCPAYWQAGDRFGRLGNKRGCRSRALVRAEHFFIDSCVSARAAENSMAMAFVNPIGQTCPNGRPDQLLGQSRVVVPLEGVIARAANRPGMITADLDLSLSSYGERVYGTREDARSTGRTH